MPRPMTEQEREAFLADLHIGVLSVANDDDRPPHAVPLWYSYRPGGELRFFTGTQGRKARKSKLIEAAGAVSMLVQREEQPYKYVSVEGRVVGVDRPPSADQMLPIVRRYLPEDLARAFVEAELARPDSELVLYTVRPERWHSFDFGDDES